MLADHSQLDSFSVVDYPRTKGKGTASAVPKSPEKSGGFSR
jgi:hypothetical protein